METIQISLDQLQKEKQDREGYLQYPDSLDEPAAWDEVADWPEDVIEIPLSS